MLFCKHKKRCSAGVVDSKGTFNPKTRAFNKRSNNSWIGITDLIIFYKNRVIFCEVKTPQRKNQLSAVQKNFRDIVLLHGQLYLLATKVGDVAELFSSIDEGLI